MVGEESQRERGRQSNRLICETERNFIKEFSVSIGDRNEEQEICFLVGSWPWWGGHKEGLRGVMMGSWWDHNGLWRGHDRIIEGSWGHGVVIVK